MTQDEIIRMAREAGFVSPTAAIHQLERFAALVAAHERNRHAWTQEHWTEYEHAIAAAEREACAKVCEETELAFDIGLWCDSTKKEMTAHTAHGLAAAIRQRGDTK